MKKKEKGGREKERKVKEEKTIEDGEKMKMNEKMKKKRLERKDPNKVPPQLAPPQTSPKTPTQSPPGTHEGDEEGVVVGHDDQVDSRQTGVGLEVAERVAQVRVSTTVAHVHLCDRCVCA